MAIEAAIDKKAAAKRSELRDNTIEKSTRSHEASLLNTRITTQESLLQTVQNSMAKVEDQFNSSR
jgi:hypothetical protein